MKKIALFLAVLIGVTSAFAREINTQMNIAKGPFYVPVTNAVFNVLGPDFESQGEVLMYMTDTTIDVQFPRTSLLSLKSVQDSSAPEYYYTPGDKGPKVRVGFEGDQLGWLFSSDRDWRVTISKNAEKNLVSATSFAQMNEDQILEMARIALEEKTDAGVFGDGATLQNLGTGVVTVVVDAMQMTGDMDDPESVGQITITLTDKGTARLISVVGSVTDLEEEE